MTLQQHFSKYGIEKEKVEDPFKCFIDFFPPLPFVLFGISTESRT